MASLKTLSLALAGFTVSAAAYGQTYSSSQIGLAMMRLNAVSLDHGKARSPIGSVWAKMRKDFRMNEVNPELVRRHESKFSANAAYFNRTVARSKPYMYHISQEVQKRNMPAEIALLPFIESAYVTKAKSRVGASGLWQFMPATGRHYGLEQTPVYDGRHDVEASTNAALNYLQYLHGLFGDWSLALAAYNWGEGNVARAVNRARAQGLDPVYENLKMPTETRNYVPKLMAVRNIVNNPDYFGMRLDNIDDKPYFKEVTLNSPIDISAAANLAGISEQEFYALNPAYKLPVFVPNGKRKMLLPVASADNFEKNYRKADQATLLSWNVSSDGRTARVADVPASSRITELAQLDRDPNPNDNRLQQVPVIRTGSNNVLAKAQTPAQPANDIQITVLKPEQQKAATPILASAYVPIRSAQPEASRTMQVASVNESKPAQIAINEPLPLPTRPNHQPVSQQIAFESSLPQAPQQAQNIQNAPSVAVLAQAEAGKPNVAEPAAAAPKPAEAAIAVADNQPAQPAVNMPALADAQPAAVQASPMAGSGSDELTNLADQGLMQQQAADAVRSALARADAAEARAAQVAAARARQQQRTEDRLARANAQSGSHRVVAGDTLYNISQRYGVSVADLIVNNNIQGNNIRQGQMLNVAAKQQGGGVRQVSYTVRKGDTLTNIASRFKVNVNDIRRWNGNSTVITPGQRINLIGL